MKKVKFTDNAKYQIEKVLFFSALFAVVVVACLIALGMIVSVPHIIADTEKIEWLKDPIFIVYFGFAGWASLGLLIVYRALKWIRESIDLVEGER